MSGIERLDEALQPARHILIDFDGPICSVFAGFPAAEVAQRMREALVVKGGSLPSEWVSESDPLALLRAVADSQPHLVPEADALLGALEEEAALCACPTQGGEALLRACAQTERAVWVVSNNSGSAITCYLQKHGLTGTVAGVFGRRAGDPFSMKPNPRLLHDAMKAADASAAECAFIGDAVRDVEAGNAAGVPTIGYANKPGKADRLSAAGAISVSDSMEAIAQAVLRSG